METLLQPGQQPGLGAGQVNTGHADLGESEFLAPRFYTGHQLTAIDLREGTHHQPIVKTRVWQDEADTERCAALLAAQGEIRDCFIALHGELGVGKTSFTRHLLRSLGVQGRIKSPTYAVVEPYSLLPDAGHGRALDIWHFDFYRFNDPREWEDAGFRELFASPGLKIAEWPEKAAAFLPAADLDIHISVQDDAVRQLRFVGGTMRGAQLLRALPP